MSGSEHEEHRLIKLLGRMIENLLDVIDILLDRKGIAEKATLVLDTMQNATKATFQEFDTAGNPVKPSGPITFASDNVAVATIDSAAQVQNPDFSVTCPVVSVAGATGTANITGVDTASANKVAAGDVDTVVTVPVATKATLVLS